MWNRSGLMAAVAAAVVAVLAGPVAAGGLSSATRAVEVVGAAGLGLTEQGVEAHGGAGIASTETAGAEQAAAVWLNDTMALAVLGLALIGAGTVAARRRANETH